MVSAERDKTNSSSVRGFRAQIEANYFALLAYLKHLAEPATLNMQQPIPAAATIATEGGYAAALAPPIELLNDDNEPIEPEFVDFTRRGEVSPTGPERPLRTVCEPSFEMPTEDTANALTTNLPTIVATWSAEPTPTPSAQVFEH
jgi:hypothetical protein